MVSLKGPGNRRRHNSILRLSIRKVLGCCLAFALTLMVTSLLSFQQQIVDDNTTTAQQQHDPFRLRNNPLQFNATQVCQVPPGQGEEGPAGIRGLYKIQQSLPSLSLLEKEKDKSIKSPRLLCMVYTHSNRHEEVLRAVAESYASQCDGFLAASNLTQPELGAWKVPHHGSELYDNMWNKVQAMWFFTYQHYLLKFDWFHIGGDDMYVIPDNLRRLGALYSQYKEPLYLGGSIPNFRNVASRFCGGGAGYTLNRWALNLLVQRMLSGQCPAETAPDEDVRLGRCLEGAGVQCHDTNDEFGVGEVRYHALDVQFHASWTPKRKSVWLWEPLQVMHGIRGNQSHLEQISNTSTTFHLDKSQVRSVMPDRGIRRYHAILYQKCGPEFQKQVEKAATCTQEERGVLRKEWMKVPTQKNRKRKKKG